MFSGERAIKHYVDKRDLKGLIGYFGLANFQEEILSMARPSKRMFATRTDNPQKLSRLGGKPVVPGNFDWPVSTAGLPLSFICQIDLNEFGFWAEENHLPPEGSLALFYDAREQPWGYDSSEKYGWRVFHFDEEKSSLELDFPLNLDENFCFPHCSLEFKDELTFPDFQDLLCENLKFAESESYTEFCNSWYQYGDDSCHRLLGYPQLIQGDVRAECNRSFHGIFDQDPDGRAMDRDREIEEEAKSWDLLLQIDNDEESGMMWGHQGTLYLCMPQDKMRERKFEDCWLILQCL